VNVGVAVSIRVLDAGSQREDVLVEATRHGEILDELVAELSRVGHLLQIDDFAFGRDLDALLDLLGELDGDRLSVVDRDPEVADPSGAEAGKRYLDLVPLTGLQHRELDDAVLVGQKRGRLDVSRLLADGDGRAGKWAGRVCHPHGHAA
jgi:hypothetical protein